MEEKKWNWKKIAVNAKILPLTSWHCVYCAANRFKKLQMIPVYWPQITPLPCTHVNMPENETLKKNGC